MKKLLSAVLCMALMASLAACGSKPAAPQAPETPAPEVSAPETPAPEAPAPETPVPDTNLPETPVAPEGSDPAAPGSENNKPNPAPTPVEPEPAPEAPATEPEAPSAGGTTLGAVLSQTFADEIGSVADLHEMAEKLVAANDAAGGPTCVIEDLSEGYLPGFSADVTGFKSCVGFMPMIGSIPYVGYVFETDDTAALLETLKSLADPRWNICTEAQETVSQVSGSYVFFAMCPGQG